MNLRNVLTAAGISALCLLPFNTAGAEEANESKVQKHHTLDLSLKQKTIPQQLSRFFMIVVWNLHIRML